MLDAVGTGLTTLLTPEHVVWMLLGIFLGIVIGAIPGINELIGLSIIMPFAMYMDRENAVPLLLGMISVAVTSGSIPSILIGTPGTSGSQATICDGFPMAKKGEAGKAMGAAFFASGVGGVLGAVVLTAALPIMEPVLFLFGSPEFFAMGVLAIVMTTGLTGRYALAGLASGGLGVLLALVGQDPINGVARWWLGVPYLVAGLSVVPVALGLFAIPEIVDLCISGTQIVERPREALVGRMSGVREGLRHWKLIAASSGIGAWVGIMPAMGTVVASWIAYAIASLFCKSNERFGKGDVWGILAPESANNSSVGGAFVPTIIFGIPGSTALALLLGVFLLLGIKPGPAMVNNPELVFLMIWTIALANVIGAVACLTLADHMAKLSIVPIHILAPLILVWIFAGSLLSTKNIGDIVVLLGFSVLGWLMKHLGWSRPALVLGFILAPILEGYYFKSVMIYGFGMLLRPVTLAILVLAVISTFYSVRILRKSEAVVQEKMQLAGDTTV